MSSTINKLRLGSLEADATSKLVPTFQAGRWIISVGFFFVVIMVEVYSAWVGGKFLMVKEHLESAPLAGGHGGGGCPTSRSDGSSVGGRASHSFSVCVKAID